MTGFDLSTASAVYYGSTPVSAIYKGSTKLWPPQAWHKVGTSIDLSTTGGTWNGYTWTRQRVLNTSGTRRYISRINFDAGDCPLTRGHYKMVVSGITQPSIATNVFWTDGSSVEYILTSLISTGVSEVVREFDFNYDASTDASKFLRFQLLGEGSYYAGVVEIYEWR